jgi:anti-sigma factor RsiW
MKPQNLHAQEDRLLDFVYGELPPLEARAVESHLEGCPRCSELLNDIRGVRTTMAQLPMESAPDAGLESLLAYAQQAARNAAAGPAPKPAWWRRWMVPVVSVAAVCAFGIVSIQVSKSVAIKPDLSAAKSESARQQAPEVAELSPPPAPTAAAPAPMQDPVASPPAVAQAAPAEAYQGAQAEGDAAKATGMTPPENAPPAKLDKALLAKEALGKNAFKPGPKKVADWSNAGSGAGFERAKDAEDEALALEEKQAADKKAKYRAYEQRDAMTQMAPIQKPKTNSMGQSIPSPEPMPAQGAAQPSMESSAGADGMLAQASVQQAESTRSSLSLNRGRSGATETANKPVDLGAADDFDDAFGERNSQAKREEQAAMPAPPPPATASATPKPKPSSMGTRAPTAAPSRAEAKGGSAESSVAQLSQLAKAAQSSGNRVLEAQYLRQALEAGATGSERLGLLNRLCDAEFSIGRRQQALEACNLVLEENPRSGAAQVARKRLSTESFDDDSAKKARPGSKASGKAAEMESAPAASTPVLKE